MTTSQLVTGVDFVGLPTHDLEAAVEFYGTTVGLRRSVYLKDRNYSEFETGNLTLSVYDAEAMGLKHSPNGNAAPIPNAAGFHSERVPVARFLRRLSHTKVPNDHIPMMAACCFISVAMPHMNPAAPTVCHRTVCRVFHIKHKPAVAKNAAKWVAWPANPNSAVLAARTA